jgi:chromosome segregation ATPase
LSKALKLQQENKDSKNELVISNLEESVKELENLLELKDSKIKRNEVDLAEAHLRIKDQATRISDQNK